MKNYTQFLEKSSDLIHRLLIGCGDARSRLRKCEVQIYDILTLEVPQELKLLQTNIAKKLSGKPTVKVGDTIV